MNTAENKRMPRAMTADVSVLRIARVYAESLLNAAEKQGQADDVLEELRSLVRDVLDVQPQLDVLFSSAALGRKARAQALNKAFEGRSSETFANFLSVLNDHERLDLIRPILAEAEALNMKRHGRVPVYVQSAVPLDDDFMGKLLDRVRAAYQKEPILQATIAPELIGGLKVRVGDLQI